jgi:broad specificity phosphatase PhoE
LATEPIQAIFSASCQSALQTAEALARDRGLKVKAVPRLQNLNHGLWHGKLIEEVRQNQPKMYRYCRENPELACPPEGESIAAARERARSAVAKILKKHREGSIALVVPEPMASMVRGFLRENETLEDLWQAETDTGDWEVIVVPGRERAREPLPVPAQPRSGDPAAET